MKPKIGFLAIGHKDYVNELSHSFTLKALDNLKHGNINIVFVEKTLTDLISAQEEAKKISKMDLDGIVIFLETWIECSVAMAAIRMIEHLPFLVWGFPMFTNLKKFREQTGSFVAYAALKGSLDRVGYNYKGVLGEVDDKQILEEVSSFSKAAYTFNRLKEARVGLIGYASMSMYPGNFDHLLLRRFIGPEVIHIDTYLLIKEIEKIKDDECRRFIKDLIKTIEVSKEVKPGELIQSIKMYLALKEIVNNYKLSALTVKCQYELSQVFGMTPCIPLSLLADEGIVSGCEGDILTLITMLIFSLISNETIAYGDVLDVTKDQIILLSSCGFAPFSLANEKKKKSIKNINEIINYLSYEQSFKEKGKFSILQGILSSNTFKTGIVTFGRLYEGIGKYKIIYGTGECLDTELRQGIMPAAKILLNGNPQVLIDNFPSQHYSFCYGDILDPIKDLCKILDIEILCI
ncbi:MAG: L-fucose/L-arabinose isomerase family protein [Candidatus Humimicrobiaceae bacterium]